MVWIPGTDYPPAQQHVGYPVSVLPDGTDTGATPLPDNEAVIGWRSGCDCGWRGRQFYPRALCTVCGADPEWERASGRGTVHTFTVIRQNYAKPFRDELPYVVAMIELAEGPMMMSNVTDCAADDVHVGMPVEAHFVTADEGIGVPFFRPA